MFVHKLKPGKKRLSILRSYNSFRGEQFENKLGKVLISKRRRTKQIFEDMQSVCILKIFDYWRSKYENIWFLIKWLYKRDQAIHHGGGREWDRGEVLRYGYGSKPRQKLSQSVLRVWRDGRPYFWTCISVRFGCSWQNRLQKKAWRKRHCRNARQKGRVVFEFKICCHAKSRWWVVPGQTQVHRGGEATSALTMSARPTTPWKWSYNYWQNHNNMELSFDILETVMWLKTK